MTYRSSNIKVSNDITVNVLFHCLSKRGIAPLWDTREGQMPLDNSLSAAYMNNNIFACILNVFNCLPDTTARFINSELSQSQKM